MLNRERVNRRRYATIAEARQDVFDYIERFHKPRVRRRIRANDNALPLTQPSAETGQNLQFVNKDIGLTRQVT